MYNNLLVTACSSIIATPPSILTHAVVEASSLPGLTGRGVLPQVPLPPHLGRF